MTMAISMAAAQGATAVICASTGNTSASAAAYAARAGLSCAVLVPRGKIALGKLAQALVHGAKLLQVDGQLRRLPRAGPQAGRRLPGGAGQLGQPGPAAGPEDGGVRDRRRARRRAGRALPAGRQRGQHHRLLDGLPGVRGGRAGAKRRPDVRLPGQRGRAHRPGEPVAHPQTIATAIRIGNPASWHLAEAARDESGGLIDSVTDRQIFAAYRMLARDEAVFGELASAARWPGCSQRPANGRIPAGSRVVCTVTGNGLKDPDWAVSARPPRSPSRWTPRRPPPPSAGLRPWRCGRDRKALEWTHLVARSWSARPPAAPTWAPGSTRSGSRSPCTTWSRPR